MNLLRCIAQTRGLLSCGYQRTEKWRESFDNRMPMFFFMQIFGKVQENFSAIISMSNISFEGLSAVLIRAFIKKMSVFKSYTM